MGGCQSPHRRRGKSVVSLSSSLIVFNEFVLKLLALGFSFHVGDKQFLPPVDNKFACDSDFGQKMKMREKSNIIT